MKNILSNRHLYLSVFQIFIYCYQLSLHVSSIGVRRRPFDNQTTKKFDIQIQGYSPSQDDDYVAVSIKAEPGYIVEFEPAAHADRVHHMLLYGCSTPAYADRNFWQGGSTCGSGSHILYAWARNAPPLTLPKDVAFAIGNDGDPVQYIVLQIHYAKKFVGNTRDFSGVTLHLSSQKPRYLAGVYLFISGEPIMPGHSAYFTNMSCSYDETDTKLYPFAFRTHTHQMGRVVSAYVKKASEGGKWTQIGKRNPQWPQLFQPRDLSTPLVIEKGDFIAAMCRFDSSDKTEVVPMGSMGQNEMCNFYMMFYWDAAEKDPFPYGGGCFGDQNPDLVSTEYPIEGTTLLPAHPDWEHQAHQSGKPFGVVEKQRLTELGGEQLGQVAGMAVDPRNGDLWIFHRAGRVWGAETFDADNALVQRQPISRPVILVARKDKNEGKLQLVAKYGKDTFYLPHGIFVHARGSIFTTDVGSHQVIKWQTHNDGRLSVVWKLGEQFVPGTDKSHFCKPAAVAVHRVDGSVFVADGYCNNRVLRFSPDGRFLSEFGQSVSRYGANLPLGQFSLPHDITLDEADDRLFVADRQNGRIQAFSMQGKPQFDVRRPELFDTVYSVHHQDDLGLLFVPGTPVYSNAGKPREIGVYVIPHYSGANLTTESHQIQFAFRPQSDLFRIPHVLRSHGQTVWVGEIAQEQGVLWMLELQSDTSTTQAQQPKSEHSSAGETEMGQLKSFNTFAGQTVGPPVGLSPGHRRQQLTYGGSSAVVLLLTLGFSCCALCLVIWRCCCDKGEQDLLDRKGFKPLRTFELDDELSSDSDEEVSAGNASGKNRESGL